MSSTIDKNPAWNINLAGNHVTFDRDGKSAYIESPIVEDIYQSVFVKYIGDGRTSILYQLNQGLVSKTKLKVQIEGIDPATLVERLAKSDDFEKTLSIQDLYKINPEVKVILGSL